MFLAIYITNHLCTLRKNFSVSYHIKISMFQLKKSCKYTVKTNSLPPCASSTTRSYFVHEDHMPNMPISSLPNMPNMPISSLISTCRFIKPGFSFFLCLLMLHVTGLYLFVSTCISVVLLYID